MGIICIAAAIKTRIGIVGTGRVKGTAPIGPIQLKVAVVLLHITTVSRDSYTWVVERDGDSQISDKGTDCDGSHRAIGDDVSIAISFPVIARIVNTIGA
jgi:hypothetical protein